MGVPPMCFFGLLMRWANGGTCSPYGRTASGVVGVFASLMDGAGERTHWRDARATRRIVIKIPCYALRCKILIRQTSTLPDPYGFGFLKATNTDRSNRGWRCKVRLAATAAKVPAWLLKTVRLYVVTPRRAVGKPGTTCSGRSPHCARHSLGRPYCTAPEGDA
jgi:hypothetical protein